MRYQTVDLYARRGLSAPPLGAGLLSCYLPDVNRRVGLERRFPAILILPGGGYQKVSSREGEPIALRFLAAGFCAFVLEYSVTEVGYPVAFTEAAMAMAYIREEAQALGVDAQKVTAMGFSAGGHLCGCLATMFREPLLGERLGDGARHARPDAAVLCYPVISYPEGGHAASFENLCGGDEALKRSLSLEDRVGPDSSPAFIWHTFGDRSVPVANSLRLAGAYQQQGVPFSLHIYERGGHGLAAADLTVYTAQSLPEVSSGLPGWLELCLAWLADRGMTPTDPEVVR